METRTRCVESVLFAHRKDAESAINEMLCIAYRYGYATIQDYYDVCDELPSSCSDGKYGWTYRMLRDNASVREDVCGKYYYISLPAAEEICFDHRPKVQVALNAHVPAKNEPGEPVNIDIYTKEILNMDVVDKFVDRIMRENPDRPVFVHIK